MSQELQRNFPFGEMDTPENQPLVPSAVFAEAFKADAISVYEAMAAMPLSARDQCETLVRELHEAPPQLLLHIAERSGFSTLAEETTLWLQDHRDVGRDSGEQRWSKEWQAGGKHHLDFVGTVRRKEFLEIAKHMILDGCDARTARSHIQAERSKRMEQVRAALKKPR